MKFTTRGDTLHISGLNELGRANCVLFRTQTLEKYPEGSDLLHIEIDLSKTSFIDAFGLGALITLQKTAASRGGIVRLLDPTPPVQQILELTRMHRILEIVIRPASLAPPMSA